MLACFAYFVVHFMVLRVSSVSHFGHCGMCLYVSIIGVGVPSGRKASLVLSGIFLILKLFVVVV